MPVARIYTRFPDEATALAERLRARGYTIELVDPGDFRVTPADLEIQLDRLKTEEAMAAAARFARTHDAEVFVAPGVALGEAALRAAREGAAERGNALVDGLKRWFAPFRRAGASAHATRAARRQAKLDAELAREAERKQKAEQQAAAKAQQDAKWASEQEIVLARQREEDARGATEREALLARQREEQARRQEEERQRREEEARGAAERAVLVAEERRRTEEIRQREEEERRQHAEAAARLAAEQAEQRKEEQARAAEVAARVAEQQRLAEEERRAEEEKERKRQAAGEAAATAGPQPMIARLQQHRQRQNVVVMKRATIAAAIVAGVLALGWGAYENRTPAQPLTNSDLVHSQSIQQTVPFGPASIVGQQPQAPPTMTTTVRPPQKQAQAKPAQGAPAKASPAQGGKPAPRRHARQFKSSPDDVDQVAEDQVIYHGAPKHSSGQASAQQPQSQVKKYSDMGDGPQ